MRPDVDGDQTIVGSSKPAWRAGPRWHPAPLVAARQRAGLAGDPPGAPGPPRPPGRGGTPPLAPEVRLDAVAAVLLDGLSYRRAGRVVGISKTEVGEAVLLDGPATGTASPRVGQQKVPYDAKRHAHTAQGVALSTVHGDLLWLTVAGRAAATSRSW